MTPSEYPQGLWTFASFERYLDDWIRPVLIADLNTVFEGARERWEEQGQPANGRGDFVLAAALFSAFDHLGQFLAASVDDSLGATANIRRVAGVLPSTATANDIVAQFGRHALVHTGWPQTSVVMDDGRWAFGLNISADPRDQNEHGERTHDLLYMRRYALPGTNVETPTLKYRLNVRVLLAELTAAVGRFECLDAVFVRVRGNAIATSQLRGKPMELRKHRHPRPGSSKLGDQIHELRQRALDEGVWPRASY
jgi:hypothetical protein